MRRLVRYVGLGLDGLLLICFALGLAARYPHPRHFWWLDFFAISLPYLSVLLVVATAITMFVRRWRLAAVHAVLLVLIGARYVSLGHVVPNAEVRGDDLTILTINAPRWWGEEAVMAGRILEMVRGEAPEIVAMQEASVHYDASGARTGARTDVRYLIDSLGYGHEGVDGRAHFRQPVLGRVPLLEQEQITLERPGWRSPSYVVRTRFRWKGREAVLYNVHLRSYGDRKPWEETPRMDVLRPRMLRSYLRQYRSAYLNRAWEADTIRAMLEREELPFIVTGDFNSTMHSWAYAEVADGLQDAFRLAGQGWGATYHNYLPLTRIDFVLASPEWRILDAHVPRVDVSDHRPLVAVLRWREGPGSDEP